MRVLSFSFGENPPKWIELKIIKDYSIINVSEDGNGYAENIHWGDVINGEMFPSVLQVNFRNGRSCKIAFSIK